MESATQPAPVSKKKPWAGIIISALPALFLLVDGVMKLAKPAFVVDTTVNKLGYPESVILPLGAVLLAGTIVYLIPRTAVLGAILLTGYLGGAVATQVRVAGGPFPILFPVIIGALLWAGLSLRDKRMPEYLKSSAQNASISKGSKGVLWTGRIISALPALFLLFGGVMNLVKPPEVVEGTIKYGYSESVIIPLGIVLLACTIIYIIPRTAVLGAILLTGYLGGAVNTHVHAGEGWFRILFPVFFGALVWGGLYLRDARLRDLLPLRKEI